MDEGRYGVARRQEDRHRKFVCVINDILKTKTEVYESCLSREKYETSFRYLKNAMTVRRNLVRKKVLQKCLEMRRRGVEDMRGQYGIYDGVSLHSMTRDVEAYIAARHPKVRRMRRVQKLLQDSIDNGAILDTETMTSKIEEFFRKRIEGMENKQEQKRNTQVFSGATSTINRSSNQSENKGLVSEKLDKGSRNKHKFKVTQIEEVDEDRDESEKTSSSDAKTTVFVLERRPTLILPPIETNKSFVQQR